MGQERSTIGGLPYELLKTMRAERQDARLDLQEFKLRASSLDDRLSGLMIAVPGIDTGLDRIDARVGLERRVDPEGRV